MAKKFLDLVRESMHPHTVALRVVLHTPGESRLSEAVGKALARVRAALPDAVKVELIDGDCGQLEDVVSLDE